MTTFLTRRTVLLAATAMLGAGSGLAATAARKPRVIKVVARKFVFVPSEIHVRKGETVVLQFTAPEVPMGVNFADFGLRTDVVPGKTASLTLKPDKEGAFTFLCDVFCGSGHEDMSGSLVVAAPAATRFEPAKTHPARVPRADGRSARRAAGG